MGRARRLGIALVRAVLWSVPLLATGLALAGGGALLWLQSTSGNAWLLAQVLPLVQPDHGALTAEGLETDVLHRLTLRGVELRDPAGALLIRVDEAEARLDTQSLLARTLPVESLTLRGVTVDLPDPAVLSTASSTTLKLPLVLTTPPSSSTSSAS